MPIPADITVGVYFPWLDYKWGYQVGVPVKNPMASDIPSIIYPWRMAVVKAYKNGQWPLWNSSYFLGMPLLANFQSAAFSPSNIFFLFLRGPLAWSWGVVSQSFLLLIFMFLYLKSKRLLPLSCLIGAVVFSLSGFAIAWNQYNVHNWTMLFLPLMLFLSDKYFEKKRMFFLPFLSLAIAGQIFSGYLPVVIYSWMIIGSYLIFKKRILKKSFFPYFLSVVLGFALASVQLFPGVELINQSIRKIDPSAVLEDVGYLPVRNLVTLAAADFFGNPATGNYWGKGFYDNFSFSIGIIPLVLTILSLFSFKKNKEVFFGLYLIALGFLLSIKNPLGMAIEKVFFLEGGISARGMFIAVFGFSLLSSLGMEEIIRNFKEKKWVCLFLFPAISFILVFAGFFILKGNADPAEVSIALRNSVICLGILATSFFVFLFTFFIKRIEKIIPLMFLFFTVFPLWYLAQKYWSFVGENLVFPETPVIEFMKKEKELSRIELGNVIPQNMWMPYGLEAVSGYDTLMPRRQGEFLSLVKNGKIGGLISRVHLMDNYDIPLFSLLNVKYVLAKKINKEGAYVPEGKPPETFTNPHFKLAFEDKTVQVYQDLRYLPRVWSVSRVIFAEDDHEIVRIMASPDFNPKVKAVIKNQIPIVDFPGKIEDTEINFLSYSPGNEEMEIVTSGSSFLVESASYYPGWKAFLNGKEIKVLETDYGLRGYFIPQAGKHHLKVVFLSESFKKGLTISLISLSLTFFWLFISRKSTTRNEI